MTMMTVKMVVMVIMVVIGDDDYENNCGVDGEDNDGDANSGGNRNDNQDARLR